MFLYRLIFALYNSETILISCGSAKSNIDPSVSLNDITNFLNELENINEDLVIKDYIKETSFGVRNWDEFMFESNSFFYMVCVEAKHMYNNRAKIDTRVFRSLKYAYDYMHVNQNSNNFFLDTVYELMDSNIAKIFGCNFENYKGFNDDLKIYFCKSKHQINIQEKIHFFLKELDEWKIRSRYRILFISDHILKESKFLYLEQPMMNFFQTELFFKNNFLYFSDNQDNLLFVGENDNIRIIFQHFDNKKSESKIHSQSADFCVYELEITDVVFCNSIKFYFLFGNDKEKYLKYITSPECNLIDNYDIFYYEANEFAVKNFKENIKIIFGNNLFDFCENCINLLKFCESKVMFSHKRSILMKKSFLKKLQKYFHTQDISFIKEFKFYHSDHSKFVKKITKDAFINSDASYDALDSQKSYYSEGFYPNFAIHITNLGKYDEESVTKKVFFQDFLPNQKIGISLKFNKKKTFLFHVNLVFVFKVEENELKLFVFSENIDSFGIIDKNIGVFNENWYKKITISILSF
ncbi:hypothetical protein CWI38_0126p0030 [Hamiltosporidium tvaerminnensis]|uniref:Uncharacterized protein n=1 Tax=Hamiltosporidium tvaerminnensis TaxID=1176355 RepID=A0A4Q9M367_9MICR|nr:hypothetical protein CWI38_0126p0030 [Hamiltosporidium tvaerminnensis]